MNSSINMITIISYFYYPRLTIITLGGWGDVFKPAARRLCWSHHLIMNLLRPAMLEKRYYLIEKTRR